MTVCSAAARSTCRHPHAGSLPSVRRCGQRPRPALPRRSHRCRLHGVASAPSLSRPGAAQPPPAAPALRGHARTVTPAGGNGLRHGPGAQRSPSGRCCRLPAAGGHGPGPRAGPRAGRGAGRGAAGGDAGAARTPRPASQWGASFHLRAGAPRARAPPPAAQDVASR